METDRYNREKNSHVMQQRGDGVSGVSIEDNRQKGSWNYLSGAPLQRRSSRAPASIVAQRAVDYNDANKRFVYVSPEDVANKEKYKERIPYRESLIMFTKYTEGTEIRSAGFNGCFMMAFKFKGEREKVENLICNPESVPGDSEQLFVAHVANNVKEALQEAEYNDLISIEAIFRPYNRGTMGFPIKRKYKNNLTDIQAGLGRFTGGMELVEGKWVGKVYSQEKKPDDKNPTYPLASTAFSWDIGEGPIFLYDRENGMDLQTLASKAYIYAHVNLDRTCSDMRRLDALHRLVEIRKQNPLAIVYACIELADQAHEKDVLNLLAPFSTIDRGSIEGEALEAYVNASFITSSEVDSTDPKYISLKRMSAENPIAIVSAYAAAMHHGESKIMECLKKFYEKRWESL